MIRGSWRPIVDDWFSIDLRSLALCRIGLAFAVLVDLCCRLPDLVAHYTDAGVLPRAIVPFYTGASRFSLHLLSGEPLIQLVLFLIAGVAALGLLAGYRTRLMTVASWFLLLSLHHRNPMVWEQEVEWERQLPSAA